MAPGKGFSALQLEMCSKLPALAPQQRAPLIFFNPFFLQNLPGSCRPDGVCVVISPGPGLMQGDHDH